MEAEPGVTGPLTWREAEHLAAAHMRALGFHDAEATPLGVDAGIDVVASGGVAQVKHFASSVVGSPDVQRLKGASHDHARSLFYSYSGYSSSAVAYADSSGVALFTYSDDGAVRPSNAVAENLLDGGYVPPDFGRSTSSRERFVVELNAYGQATIDCCTRLIFAISEVMSDPDWIASITEDYFHNQVTPAISDMVRLQETFQAINGEHEAGYLVTKIAEAEGTGQRVARVFGLAYEDFLSGESVNE